MSVEGEYVVSTVGEREIDLAVIQLLETSEDFRRWFFDQTLPSRNYGEYLGSARSVNDSTGESDIEVGYTTQSGERAITLVENKITAAKQENQVERYYKRGRRRINRGNWDTYSVGLIAPEHYVSDTDEEEFEYVLLYEDLIGVLEELDYDGREFLLGLFDQAISKSTYSGAPDFPPTTDEIADEIHFRMSELPDIKIKWVTPKHVEIVSDHPEHPDIVQYRAYIAEHGIQGKTDVRLQLENIDDDEVLDELKSVVAAHIDQLPGYELNRDVVMEVAKREIWHEDYARGDSEGHIDAVVDELCKLINVLHPAFIEETELSSLSTS